MQGSRLGGFGGMLLAWVGLVLAGLSAGWGQLPFVQPTVVRTGNWPVFVGTADLNGDGYPDLVYIDQGGTAAASTTHVLLNDGKGNFTQSALVATQGTSVAIGDFTGDGHVDLGWVTARPATAVQTNAFDYTLSVAAGRGDGTFAATEQRLAVPDYGPTGGQTPVFGFLLAAQVQGSGALDLIAEDTTNQNLFDFKLNSGGAAHFAGFSLASYGCGPMSVADLNGDGFVDLVIDSQKTFTADVFLNASAASGRGFAAAPVSSVGSAHSLILRDVNLDGIPDLVVEGAAGRIDVFAGNGDGTFSATSIGGTGTLDGTTGNGGHLIAVADLNGDGQLDALTATPAGISALLGQGTQYLGLKGIYNAGPGHTSYVTADFNGDGVLDVAVDAPEGIAILYGNGDGGFRTNLAFAAGRPAMSGAVGVFTASGKKDLAVSTGAKQAQVLLGAGDGTFVPVGGASSPVPTNSAAQTAGIWSVVQALDLNNDGKTDLLLTADGSTALTPSTPDGVVVALGDGTGGFAAAQVPGGITTHCTGSPGPLYGTSTAISFNSGAPYYNPEMVIWNQSADAERLIIGGVIGDATYAAFHGCGANRHDLLTAGFFASGTYADVVEQQDSHMYLNSLGVSAGVAQPFGDLSVDGSLTTSGQMVAPNVSSTFGGVSSTFGFPVFPGTIAVADLDQDGNNDVLVAYADLDADLTAPVATKPNYLYVWFGSGGGKFLTSAAHPVNPVRVQLTRNYYQVAVGDLNGDGVPDLVLSDGYIVSVQYGKGDGTFGVEQHLLAGQGINTVSLADVRHTGVMDLVVANGGAVLTNPVANLEVLGTNADVNTGGVTVLLNTGAAASAPVGTLTASPEPAPFEAGYTLTATVSGPGTVAFTVDGTAVGTVTTTTNTATLTVPMYVQGSSAPPLLPGTHALGAVYTATNSSLATMLTGAHVVSLGPTTTTLTPTTPQTIYFGQAVDGVYQTFFVDSTYSDGTYTLLDNGVPSAGCINLPYGTTCPYGYPVILDAGPHVFTIQYNGSAINAPSSSTPFAYTILPDLTTAGLVSSLQTAVVGTAVTFTATIAGNQANEVPNGTVTFFDGASAIGTVTLVNGVATLSTSLLAIGSHTVKAVYGGTIDFNPATSNAVTVVITPPVSRLPSTTLLMSNLNPAPVGAGLTFTATVAVSGPFVQYATGTVTFLDGTAVIGTGTLNALGVATFSTANLALGSHAITASYGGDQPVAAPGRVSAGTLPSVSAVLTEVVVSALGSVPSGFTLSVTPVPVTIGAGRTAVLLVTVTEFSGFNQAVTLGCTGLATEVGCNFVTPVIAGGGGATTLEVSTAAPHDCGDPAHPYFLGSYGGVGGVLACGMLLGFVRRRRVLRVVVLSVGLLGGLVMMNGCGHCTDLGTRPGTYSFLVTGTAAGGAVQAQKVSMTVTIP